ncbi:MAG: hypothetical protein ABI863_06980 [Ginsengibacter sp.]
MIKPPAITIFIIVLLACSANKKAQVIKELPECLATKIKAMTSDPGQGSPLSVTRYIYRQQTVYYMVSPCCDKFNIVYDSVCNILGRPDGGFTGRGDGKMTDFKKEATNEKVIWKINK